MKNQTTRPQNKLKDVINIKNSADDSIPALKAGLNDSTDIGALMRKALQGPKVKNANLGSEVRASSKAPPASNVTKSSIHSVKFDVASPPSNEHNPQTQLPTADVASTPHHNIVDKEAVNTHKANVTSSIIPLAARSLISKRRRKSVFQRPARYGEWFDGDDDELEAMVDDEEDDDDGDDCDEEDHNEQQIRNKYQTNTVTNKNEDVVNKVKAIAEGLCEKLDGLIEESPALPRGMRREEKSLRDKLLESWEGRSYYERLMQMAGGSAEEQEELRAELAAAKAAAATKESDGNVEQQPHQSYQQQQQKQQQPTHAGVLSFLSPPKPKLRAELEAAMQAAAARAMKLATPEGTATEEEPPAVRPIVSNSVKPTPVVIPPAPPAPREQDKKERSGSTRDRRVEAPGGGLLKVSARGPKTMPAPWQQQTLTSPKSMEDVEKLRAALSEATAAKIAAEKAAAAARAENEDAKKSIEKLKEEVKSEVALRHAAEERILALEAELAALQGSSDSPSSNPRASHHHHHQLLNKIAGDVEEMQGKFGLAQAQLEALLAAAHALSQHISSGEVAAQDITNTIATTLNASDGNDGGDQGSKKQAATRTSRRKLQN